MSETINISEMAKKMSKDIFSIFGWEMRGPADQNWPCRKDHRTKNTAEADSDGGRDASETASSRLGRTHPSDVVFRYDDPYTDAAAYLTTDLKSFGKESINKTQIGKALRSLCSCVDCANVVGEWASSYVSGDDRWHAHGMLFVYNHDGKYDAEAFRGALESATPSYLRVPADRHVYVFGPGEIAHLHAVARDLMVYRGRPDAGPVELRWFTPDLITRKSRSTSFGKAAPAEVLLGPWQIAGIAAPGQPVPQSIRLYYRCRGSTVPEEIEYLIEFLFRHHLLDWEIQLCFVGAENGVLSAYQAAVNNVVAALYGLEDIRQRLGRIKPEVLSEFQTRFFTENIGMERNLG